MMVLLLAGCHALVRAIIPPRGRGQRTSIFVQHAVMVACRRAG